MASLLINADDKAAFSCNVDDNVNDNCLPDGKVSVNVNVKQQL